MPVILYKAPDCLRCNIVKHCLDARGIAYKAYQLDTDNDIVSAFYRAHRARLYRNPEGTEFPMFHDTDRDVILQGTGQILAWLLSGPILEPAVTRSGLLHGWISGLDISRVPDGAEEHFLRTDSLARPGRSASKPAV